MRFNTFKRRVERLEAKAPARVEDERVLSVEEMGELLAGLAGDIAAAPDRRRAFLGLIDGAWVTTAEIADLYFELPPDEPPGPAGVIELWLWLAAINGHPWETIEAWAGGDNYYNLTRYQAELMRERLPE